METQTIPQIIKSSPLFTEGGYAVYDNLLDNQTVDYLTHEAVHCYENSNDQQVEREPAQPMRGGIPARSLFSSNGEQYQDSVYQNTQLVDHVCDICGHRVEPSGTRGSYSYYVRKGDHLDIHRDIDTCDVTLITILQDNMEHQANAGKLAIFPECYEQTIPELRSKQEKLAKKVELLTTQSIVFYGGYLPHMVTPCIENQARIISALCYRAII